MHAKYVNGLLSRPGAIVEREQRVSFYNGQGQRLEGVFHHPSRNPLPAAAILCHGMESNKESDKIVALARELAQRGISALRFDFSCAGESSGKFGEITYSGEVEDLKAAFDYALRYPVNRIGILGSSMGGTVALLFAANEGRTAAIVTIAAPVHPERITERLLTPEAAQEWRRKGYVMYHGRRLNISFLEDLEKIRVPDAARKISCPALVIHGDRDETVPVEEAYELYEQLGGPKRLCILQGADHRFSDPPLLRKALQESLNWLTEQLL